MDVVSHLAECNIGSNGRLQAFCAFVAKPSRVSITGPESGSKPILNTCTLSTEYYSIQIMPLELFQKWTTVIIAEEHMRQDVVTCLFLCVLLCYILKWVSWPMRVCLHGHLGKNWRTDLGPLGSSV